jgi:hypothetical protein
VTTTLIGIALALAALWLARKGFRLERLARRAPSSEWRREKEEAALGAWSLAALAAAAGLACFLGG